MVEAVKAAGQGLPQAKDTELRKAVEEFEALLINQMLKSMRETVEKGDLFHGGSGEEIYTSMLDSELSREMSRAGGIGLAEMLLKQLEREEGSVAVTSPQAQDAPREAAKAPAVRGDARPGPDGDGFVFPLKEMKRVSSLYGERIDPFTGEARFHHGIDIAAREGTPVYPAAAGKVVFSGARGGYGNVVEVLHGDGVLTRYAHNSGNLVKAGDTVSPAIPIALVGSTGRSTGAHLHFEVVRDGVQVDPYSVYG